MKNWYSVCWLLVLALPVSCTAADVGPAARRIAPGLSMTVAMRLPHREPLYQRHPAVAYGDGTYLLVWQDGYHGVGGQSDILGLRLDRRGAPLDKQPIRLSDAGGIRTCPAVAYGAGRFLVAWADLRNGRDYDVYGARLGPKGPAGKPFLLAGGRGAQAHPALASDGKDRWLAVWQTFRSGKYFEIAGVRLDAKGSPLDEAPFRILPRGEIPAVTWTGKHFLVCQRWYAALVARDGTVTPAADGKRLWNGKTVLLPAATAAWGKGFVFFNVCPKHDPWGWGGNGAIIGCTVLPDGTSPEWSKVPSRRALSRLKADGKLANCLDAARWKGHKGWPMGRPGGFKTTEEGTWPSGRVGAAWNGKSIVVVWNRAHIVDKQRLANRDLYLRRVRDDWAYADPAKVRIVAGPTEEVSPVLAAGPAGQVLLAYERLRPEGGVEILYHIVVESG
jgi:hypothetical protein